MASSGSYMVGDVVVLSARFTTTSGVAVDPDTVVCKVKSPGGVAAIQVNVKDGVGLYHVNYSLAGCKPGRYVYQWEGSGAASAVREGSFTVERSEI